MRNLYGRISINKKFNEGKEQINENINYYKLRDSKFGLEIEKEQDNKEVTKLHIINITEDEDKINYILKELLKHEVMPESEDIIEDLVKQYI